MGCFPYGTHGVVQAIRSNRTPCPLYELCHFRSFANTVYLPGHVGSVLRKLRCVADGCSGHCLVYFLTDCTCCDRQGEVLNWCRKRSGCAQQRMEHKIDERLQAREGGHEEYGRMLKTSSGPRRRKSRKLENRRTKEKDYKDSI